MSIDKLTLAEVAEVEDLAGQPFQAVTEPAAMKGRLMQAIVYVLKRQENPDFTFDDAGQMTMAEMNEVLAVDPKGSN